MRIGGTVEGVTSKAISRRDDEVAAHRKDALAAMIDYYASNDDGERALADERVREAFGKAASAGEQRDGLQQLQADAQASRQQIADWAKLF